MPINIDSIRIASLSHVVDSLSQQVHDSRISEGYFTALLSIQTGVFLAIIGIAAFIAWKSIIDGIKQSHNKIIAKTITFQKGVNEKIDMFNGELSSQLVEINRQSSFTEELLYRSMYIISDTNKSYSACFYWAIRTIHIILQRDTLTEEEKLDTLLNTDAAQDTLKGIIDNDKTIEDKFLKEMVSKLEFCIAYKEGIYKDKYQKILDDMSKYYYTNLPTSSEPIVPNVPAT